MEHIKFEHIMEGPFNVLVDPPNKLKHAQNLVILRKFIRIRYNYPFINTVIKGYRSNSPDGFSLAYLAKIIKEEYFQFYQEENKIVGDSGYIFLGPYGIWEEITSFRVTGLVEEGNLFGLEIFQ